MPHTIAILLMAISGLASLYVGFGILVDQGSCPSNTVCRHTFWGTDIWIEYVALPVKIIGLVLTGVALALVFQRRNVELAP